MFPAFRSARRMSSQVALAIALASGTAIATAIAAPAAQAQEVPNPSAGFVTVYNQVAPLLSGETQDYSAAQTLIPSLVGAVQNNRDRDIAGNVLINIGGGVSDRQLQRRGIIMRLDAGLVAPEQVGLLNWYAGNFAIEADEFAQARTHLNAAMAAGYTDEQTDIINLIARTYLEEGDDQGSYNYLMQAIAEAEAAGNVPPEAWVRNSLQYAYQNRLPDQTTALVLRLVGSYPNDRAWSDGLRIMSQTLDVSEDATIDLFRLMAERDALVDRNDLRYYIEALDPRLAANEVQDILRMGVEAGFWAAGDGYYDEVSAIAARRAAADRSSGGQFVSEGRTGDALDAMNSGNALFSIDDYARAEEMFALARERGFDADAANIRIGVAQAMQGKSEEALASFANVGGPRAPIAALWTAHIKAVSGTGTTAQAETAAVM